MSKIKIGILTFYDTVNYGAALQAYALQQAIKSYGAEPEFLSYIRRPSKASPSTKDGYISSVLKQFNYYISILIHLRRTIITKQHSALLKESFVQFKNNYMNCSREFYYDNEDFSFANSKYHGFITGSDMVWTPIKQNLYPYFLQFADREKRYSYAPSLTGCSNYSEEDIRTITNYLQGFDIISCREQEGVDFVKKYTGKEALLTVDPTLLFNKEQWKEHLHIKEYKTDKPYILCYTFGGLPTFIKNEVSRIAKDKHMDVRYIPMSSEELLNEISCGHGGTYGPKEFVELFINASFVVTNSFHGFLFSLISEKPFIVLHRESSNNWKANESRISNILDKLNETERFIESNSTIHDKFLDLDYKNINDVISSMRQKSLDYLDNILTSISGNKINEYKSVTNVKDLSIKLCTGCGVCSDVCPFSAIKIVENEEGFMVPHVDIDLCRECGKCAKNCPSINHVEKRHPSDTHLCLSKDDMIESSASGGVFITVARYFIEQLHGVVFGVILDKDLICRHVEGTTLKDLIPMQNSKYIQSITDNCYVRVKQRLEEGRHVLFTGTPCQIAALRSFVKNDYDNLLTMDVVCHGVPSQNFWKTYITNYQNKGEINNFKFRNRANKNTWDPTSKRPRRGTQEATIVSSWGVERIPALNDPYYAPFVRCESYRLSCYYCKYGCKERVSDITIGDCDSDMLYPDFYPYESKSIVLVNTEKGKKMWNLIQGRFRFRELDYKEEIARNTCLRHPSIKPESRDFLYDDLFKLSWKDFSKKYSQKKIPIDSFIHVCIKYFGTIIFSKL